MRLRAGPERRQECGACAVVVDALGVLRVRGSGRCSCTGSADVTAVSGSLLAETGVNHGGKGVAHVR